MINRSAPLALNPVLLCFALCAAASAEAPPTLANDHLRVWINPQGAKILRLQSGNAVFTPDPSTPDLDAQMLWDSIDDRMGGEFATGSYMLTEEEPGVTIAALPTSDGAWKVSKSFFLDGSSLRVIWEITNTSDQPREIMPWVLNRAMPGREVDRHCVYSYVAQGNEKVTLTHGNLGTATFNGFTLPARPWFAITDPLEKVSLVWSFEWEKLNWFGVNRIRAVDSGMGKVPLEFEWAYAPVELSPGETWQTTYQLTVLRSLERVDWFSQGYAASFDVNTQDEGKGDGATVRVANSRGETRATVGGYRIASVEGRELGRKDFPAQTVTMDRDVARCMPAHLPLGRKGSAYSVHVDLPAGEAFEGTFEIADDRTLTATTTPLLRNVRTSGIQTPFPYTVKQNALFPRKAWQQREVKAIADTPRALVWAQNSMRKVWRAEKITAAAAGAAATLSAPRGGRVSTSVVVRPKTADLKKVTLSFGDLAGPDGATIARENILVRRIGFLEVRYTSDLVKSRFEPAGDVLYDENTMDLAPDVHNPFYVTVKVPYDVEPGVYKATGALTDDGGDKVADVPLKLHVRDVDLPKASSLWSLFAFDTTSDPRRHERLTDMRLEHGPVWPEVIPFYFDGEKWIEQLDKWGAYAEELFNAGLTSYCGYNSLWSYSGVIWKDGYPEDKRNAVYDYAEKHKDEWADKWLAYATKRGWADRFYWYVMDEPAEDLLGIVREQCDWAHRRGIKTMTAVSDYHPGLEGYLDIWCPISPAAVSPRLDAARARGDQVIWYVCCGPKNPYPNVFTEYPALDARIWLWQTYFYDLTGILYWQTTFWANNPERVLKYADNYATERNGDGLLFYPNPNGPGVLDSLRIELLAEGVQEYDLLRMVEAKIGRAEVMKRLNLNDLMGPRPWDYTRSPEALADTRGKLLQLAEEVLRTGD